MRTQLRFHSIAKGIGFAAVLGSSSLASAALPTLYIRPSIPDFDQVWQLEPMKSLANSGKMYCVPTSYLNFYEYLDKNGLAGMSSVSDPSEAQYEGSIISNLLAIGYSMDTNATTGTNSQPALDASKERLKTRAPNVLFLHYFYGADWDWGTHAIRKAVASGALVRIGYGRYYNSAIIGGPSGVYFRKGGHSVVVAGFDYLPSGNNLFISDPATDNKNYLTQSSMTYDYNRVQNRSLNTSAHGWVSHAQYKDVGSFLGYPVYRMVDNMHQILPIYAGYFSAPAYQNSALGDGSVKNNKFKGDGSVRVVMPWQPTDQRGQVPNVFEFKPRENMVDWILASGEMSAYYVTHLGRIFKVDLQTGEHKLLHVIKGAKKLIDGGTTLDLYALVEGRKNDRIVKIERDDNSLVSRDLPGKAIAMEFDPKTGGPAVLDANLGFVHSLNEDLADPETTLLPDVPTGSGRLLFKIDHNTGEFLLARQGATTFLRYTRERGIGRSSEIKPRILRGINGFAPTENGLLVIQDGAILRTIDANGADFTTQLTGLVAEGELRLPRSHVAAKLHEMVGPGWENIDPDDLD